jgi:DeoR/GlpR family transcriptional regulator of sugar metabolism
VLVWLADSSKYGSWSLFCAAPLESLTDIVTDERLEEAARHGLRERGIGLLLTA